MDHLTKDPLNSIQKSIVKSHFKRTGPLKHDCLHCRRALKTEHIKRLASHFIRCKKSPVAEVERFLSEASTLSDTEGKLQLDDDSVEISEPLDKYLNRIDGNSILSDDFILSNELKASEGTLEIPANFNFEDILSAEQRSS